LVARCNSFTAVEGVRSAESGAEPALSITVMLNPVVRNGDTKSELAGPVATAAAAAAAAAAADALIGDIVMPLTCWGAERASRDERGKKKGAEAAIEGKPAWMPGEEPAAAAAADTFCLRGEDCLIGEV
jgi:hypothetical protein